MCPFEIQFVDFNHVYYAETIDDIFGSDDFIPKWIDMEKVTLPSQYEAALQCTK